MPRVEGKPPRQGPMRLKLCSSEQTEFRTSAIINESLKYTEDGDVVRHPFTG